jgi:hypothetical protein
MCDRCDLLLPRRRFLGLGAGAAALAAGALTLPGISSAAAAAEGDPFETTGLGEEWLPGLAAASGSAAPGNSWHAPAPGRSRALVVPARPPIPALLTRKDWGADESVRTTARAFAPVRKIVVHHSASANKPRDPVGVVRSIYEFHVKERKFADIGYNFLIDHRGVVYEGRYARDYGSEPHTGQDTDWRGVVGAHALGVNVGSVGICLIGDFTYQAPTEAAINSLIAMCAWLTGRHKIDPVDSDDYLTLFGERRTFPNISGHRQTVATTCPGDAMFSKLGAVRKAVANWAGRFPAQTVNMAASIRYADGQAPITPDSSGSGSSTPLAPDAGLLGYRVGMSNGNVVRYGRGSPVGTPLSRGVSALRAIAGVTGGYLSLDAGGKVEGFGVEAKGGLTSGQGVPADLAARPDASGFWILRTDGGIHPFGSASWYGSPLSQGVRATAMKLRALPNGGGYWVLSGDGRIRAYGNAPAIGVPRSVSAFLVDFWPTPSGRGYWVLGQDGRVYAMGDAPERGDLKDKGSGWTAPAVGIVGTPNGKGYAIVDAAGRVHGFGSALAYQNVAAQRGVVGVAAVTGR